MITTRHQPIVILTVEQEDLMDETRLLEGRRVVRRNTQDGHNEVWLEGEPVRRQILRPSPSIQISNPALERFAVWTLDRMRYAPEADHLEAQQQDAGRLGLLDSPPEPIEPHQQYCLEGYEIIRLRQLAQLLNQMDPIDPAERVRWGSVLEALNPQPI